MPKLFCFTKTLSRIFMVTLLTTANFALATDEPPIPLPKGAHTFQGTLFKKLLKKSKLFNHNNEEDAATIKTLKDQGFFCFRRSMEQTSCQLKTTSFELPENTSALVKEKLKHYPIVFPDAPEVQFTHDGSTTQEWLVRGTYFIGEKKLGVYRITRTSEGEIFIAFPVDEENPISFLTYRESLGLGFTMVLQGTDSEGWKLSYYFEALYKPESH